MYPSIFSNQIGFSASRGVIIRAELHVANLLVALVDQGALERYTGFLRGGSFQHRELIALENASGLDL